MTTLRLQNLESTLAFQVKVVEAGSYNFELSFYISFAQLLLHWLRHKYRRRDENKIIWFLVKDEFGFGLISQKFSDFRKAKNAATSTSSYFCISLCHILWILLHLHNVQVSSCLTFRQLWLLVTLISPHTYHCSGYLGTIQWSWLDAKHLARIWFVYCHKLL